MNKDTSGWAPRRRDMWGLAFLGLGLAGASAAHAATAGCDAEDTNRGRLSMRKALEYLSPSKTPGKVCSGCAYFAATATAAGAPACGKCQLLNNGPVAGDAVCGSWAPKS